jgi:hypothetical protein
MADKTFKVGDRITHIKMGRTGKITWIDTKQLEGAPKTFVPVYRIKLDDSPNTVEAYAHEIELRVSSQPPTTFSSR